MPVVANQALYAACAVVTLVVAVAGIRAAHRTWFRAALLAFLAGALWWSVIDLLRWVIPGVDLVHIEAWTLPAGALVVAGLRIGVYSATSPGWRMTRVDAIGFAAHPVATVLIAVSSPLHSYVARPAESGIAYGPIFWAHVAACAALMTSATIDVIRLRSSLSHLAGKALPVLLAVWITPVVTAVLSIVWAGPIGIDLMPYGLAVVAIVVWKGVVPADLRMTVPIARAQVFNELDDAVFVIDERGELLDANAAGLALAGATKPIEHYLGDSLWRLWPDVAKAAQHAGEFDLECAGSQLVLDVSITGLTGENGAPRGRAVVMRNVTASVHQRRELARLRAELAELVIKDPVTGLNNRRYAEQTLPQTLARCKAKNAPFSVAIVDVDHFKAVNDTFGHIVGDRVLHVLASAMKDAVPASMLARIGGEEFLVMLPGLTEEQAVLQTEKLRAACARAEVRTRERALRVTVSAGVATTSDCTASEAELTELADRALYLAKRQGRDRTSAASALPLDPPPDMRAEGRRKRPGGEEQPRAVVPAVTVLAQRIEPVTVGGADRR